MPKIFKKSLVSAVFGVFLGLAAGCVSIRPELSTHGEFPFYIERLDKQPTLGSLLYNAGEFHHEIIQDSAGELRGVKIKKYNWTGIPQGKQTLMAPEKTTNVGIRGPYEFLRTYYWISFDVEKKNFPGIDVKEGRWVDEYILSNDAFFSSHNKRLYWSPDLQRLIKSKNKKSLEEKFLDYNKKEKPYFMAPDHAPLGWFGNKMY